MKAGVEGSDYINASFFQVWNIILKWNLIWKRERKWHSWVIFPGLVNTLSQELLVRIACNFIWGDLPTWPRNEKVWSQLSDFLSKKIRDLVNMCLLVRITRDFVFKHLSAWLQKLHSFHLIAKMHIFLVSIPNCLVFCTIFQMYHRSSKFITFDSTGITQFNFMKIVQWEYVEMGHIA